MNIITQNDEYFKLGTKIITNSKNESISFHSRINDIEYFIIGDAEYQNIRVEQKIENKIYILLQENRKDILEFCELIGKAIDFTDGIVTTKWKLKYQKSL